MAKTRGVKRSTTYSEYDFEMAELLEDEDLFLEQEEAKAAAAVKKPKTSELVFYKSKLEATFDSLYFALPVIVSFLDSRSLLQAAATNKFLSETVLTPQTVLRAAIFGDKQSRDTMESVMALIQRHAIHTPSTSRLLRLTNATRCEGGADCWAFHHATGNASALTNSSLSMVRSLGLCLCSTCKRFVCSTNTVNWRIFVELERRQLAAEKRWRVIRAPYKEKATGVPVGPVISGRDLQQVASNYKESQEREGALEAIHLQRTPSAEELARREILLDIYKATKTEFEAPKLAAEMLKAEEAKVKMVERAKRKRDMGEPILSQMESLLSEYPHKDIALAGAWDENSGVRHFTFLLSREILGRLFYAPSNASQKSIEKAVNDVQEMYSLLLHHGFGTGPDPPHFFSDLEESEDISQVAIHKWRNNMTAYSSPRDFLRHHAGRHFVEAIKKNGPLASVFEKIPGYNQLWLFCCSVAEEGEMSIDFEVIAQKVWAGTGLHNHTKYSFPSFCFKIERNTKEYSALASAMKSYLRKPAVQAFLEEHQPLRPLGVTPRLVLKKKLFGLAHGSRKLLEDRNFNELFKLHKRINRDPYAFSQNQQVF